MSCRDERERRRRAHPCGCGGATPYDPHDPQRQGGLPPPEDPQRQGGLPPPEDPQRQGGLPPPEDPQRQGGLPPPEDPQRQGGLPPPEDPQRQGGLPPPEDPSAAGGSATGGSVPAYRSSCRLPSRRPLNARRAGSGRHWSGTVVVRLVPEVAEAIRGALAQQAPAEAEAEAKAARSERKCEGLDRRLRRRPGLDLLDCPGALDRFPALRAALLLADFEDLPQRAPAGRDDRPGRDDGRFGLAAVRPVIGRIPLRRLLDLEARAASSPLPPQHSLSQYWRIEPGAAADRVEELVCRLSALGEVDLAYRELEVTQPAHAAGGFSGTFDQGYLDEAPVGIGARRALDLPGGRGAGVSLVDVEQGWIVDHRELAHLLVAQVTDPADNRHGVGGYRGDHGTAVLGEVVARHDASGVSGIAPEAGPVAVASHFDHATASTLHVADAIVAAVAAHEDAAEEPGVLLLEVQRSFAPTEVDDADFDAIRLATALGHTVVEAAGNGALDLDAWEGPAGRVLAPGAAAFRDSGAILVGAAEPDLPHDRAWFSNFGQRVDAYAWGDGVVTSGYGDLAAGADDGTASYTATFGGTSGAAPIVAGAALVVQGMRRRLARASLPPLALRAALADPATGTPQGPGRSGAIGVMPDLAAVLRRLCLVPGLHLAAGCDEDAGRWIPRPLGESPDLGLSAAGAQPSSDPAAALPFATGGKRRLAAWVRVRNRGLGDVEDARVTLHGCPATTLATPDLWHPLGEARVDVPQAAAVLAGPLPGDVAAAADAAGPPLGRHPTLLAVVDHRTDPAPPPPPAHPRFFRWEEFLRWQASDHVGVRSRHRVRAAELADGGELELLVAGAPDAPRRFDLELRLLLPAGVAVHLAAPPALAARLVALGARPHETGDLRLPALPCLEVCGVGLAAGARLPCRLRVHGGDGAPPTGRITVRQLWRGREVGRVGWEIVG